MALEETENLTSLTYEDVFSSGIPRELEVRELDEILAEIRARKF
jgi:hypothetical protein